MSLRYYVEKHGTARHAKDDNITGRVRVLDNYGYRHTSRIFNTYCFYDSTVVARIYPNVTLYVYCLSCGLHIHNSATCLQTQYQHTVHVGTYLTYMTAESPTSNSVHTYEELTCHCVLSVKFQNIPLASDVVILVNNVYVMTKETVWAHPIGVHTKIIIIVFLHGLGRLTCSDIDASPSFPWASTISSSSRFVFDGVFRESGVVSS